MSSNTASTRAPVITGWSAVSSLGIGQEAFVRGAFLDAGQATILDPQEWTGPDTTAFLVPGFNISEILGRRGTRSMDRVTGLAVTTVGQLRAVDANDGDSMALVLGTNTGSMQSIMDLTRSSFTEERPFYVDPSRFPNTVMNCAAGQSAIWHGLTGPNTTVAAGRASAILALSYARRLLATRRAESVLCGAAEEYSSARSWLEWHTRDEQERIVPLGEGCALVQLRNADAVADGEGMAELLAVESGVVRPGEVHESLVACLRRMVRRTGLRSSDVWATSSSGLGSPLGEAEGRALDTFFGSPPVRRITQPGSLGDTSAATAAFQLVSVLAAAEKDDKACGRAAVILSADRDGAISCAVLRMR